MPDSGSANSSISSDNSSGRKSRFLVVEDEALVSLLIEDMIIELGHDVTAVAQNAEQAMEALKQGGIDAAVLDVNLAGRPSYEIASELLRRNIPFAFSTGYGVRGLREDFRAYPVLQKPFQIHEMQSVLDGLIAAAPT